MYKLKVMAKRGSALVGAVGLLAGIGTSAVPSLASADALNPLTQRSLLLSSSSPGWAYTDGSGNSTYAMPNSGTNGKKTGETFTFRVSSTGTIKGFTFQFCTSAAGYCTSPGNDSGGNVDNDSDPSTLTPIARGNDDTSHSDLNVVLDGTHTPSEVSAMPSRASGIPLADNTEGNFAVQYSSTHGGSGLADTLSSGWSMAAVNNESYNASASDLSNTIQTGKMNYIKLTNGTGQALQAGDQVKVTFYATNYNYITNPGDGAFFVKINDYNSATTLNDTTLVDGGVTVANIMNQSIQIQTKVLETMDFSVGTVDPDTVPTTNLASHTHGQCDAILTGYPDTSGVPQGPANSLYLGNTSAENSLETGTTYATHSFWRLSSNSSGGATVYYSGNTLANTEGDKIAPLGDNPSSDGSTLSVKGSEQFGLAIDHGSDTTTLPGSVEAYPVDSAPADAQDTGADTGTALDSAFNTYVTTTANDAIVHKPRLYPLVPKPSYGGGAGAFYGNSLAAKFAFNANANTVPVPIASESNQVVNCVTARMRYIGNIAATTPAGIYTTKINYLAAPQY